MSRLELRQPPHPVAATHQLPRVTRRLVLRSIVEALLLGSTLGAAVMAVMGGLDGLMTQADTDLITAMLFMLGAVAMGSLIGAVLGLVTVVGVALTLSFAAATLRLIGRRLTRPVGTVLLAGTVLLTPFVIRTVATVLSGVSQPLGVGVVAQGAFLVAAVLATCRYRVNTLPAR